MPTKPLIVSGFTTRIIFLMSYTNYIYLALTNPVMKTAAELPSVAEILKESNYGFEETTEAIKIKRSRSGKIVYFTLFESVSLILLITGILNGFNMSLILSALIAGSLPLLFDRMSWPHQVTIDKARGTIKFKHGLSYSREIILSNIASLVVDEEVLDSDTSPFKEGYQDFNYSYFLISGKRKIKLIRFSFRKKNAEQMQLLFTHFRQALSL